MNLITCSIDGANIWEKSAFAIVIIDLIRILVILIKRGIRFRVSRSNRTQSDPTL